MGGERDGREREDTGEEANVRDDGKGSADVEPPRPHLVIALGLLGALRLRARGIGRLREGKREKMKNTTATGGMAA